MSKQNKNKNRAHLFENAGAISTTTNSPNIGGVTSIATGVLSLADSISTPYKDINNADVQLVKPTDVSQISDLDTLQTFQEQLKPQQISYSDVGGHSTGQSWANIGKGAGAGASIGTGIGSFFGPIGAVLGGGVGGILGGGISAVSEAVGGKRAKQKQKDEQALADANYTTQENILNNRAYNIQLDQLVKSQRGYINALGGNLHSNSTTWSNGLNYIGSGGSHESNPNDGVAISTAPDGLQNKVEEGEVVWNDDYVFSKRLKVPKKDLEKNKWKGETYADIAKKLMDESAERPNDPITLRGLDDSLSRLRDSQEELKAKQEGNKIKKEIASMPPELLAQMQQAQQQPTEEEIMQQQAMEQIPQEQIAMVDPSMQQPMMEQPPMYAKGGHLFGGENSFIDNGGSVKAISGESFLNVNPILPLVLEKVGVSREPTAEEIEAAKATINNSAFINYINRQNEYVNVDDAQKYGGFYKDENGADITDINTYLDGHTPMDVNNKAQGVANQQSKQSGLAYINRFPVKTNYGLPKDAIILDRNNKESVDFFLKKNPNLDLNSDTIYFYSKDKNDVVDKNKSVKANKVKPEVYEKNNVKNISKISGINFDRTNMKAKGGHLHYDGSELLRSNLSNDEYSTYLLNPYINRDYSLSALSAIEPQLLQTISPQLIKKTYTPKEQRQIAKIEKDVAKREARTERAVNKESKDNNFNFDPTYMRYAPVLGSIFNVARSIADRPDYGNPERIERAAARVGAQVSPKYIGDYLRYRPLDEAYYLNQLNAQQNAANNNIIGLSNGNRSMALASMLVNDYNYNNQRGAAYRQGLEYNEAQRQRAAEFNRGTNQFNAQQYMQAAAQNASNRAQAANLISAAAQMREGIDNAYGASQSANWTSLFNNLGNVGKDEMNRKMTNGLYDYSWLNRSGDWGFNGQSRKSKRGGYLTIKTNNRRKE